MTRVLYKESNFPILQNRVYGTYEEAIHCPQGDIQIIEDDQSGLIYNAAFRPELMLYDSNYNNEQANSVFFQQHLTAVKEIIRRELGQQELVEVGCGKGFFFEMLLADSFDVTGFDPTYEGSNPRIVKEYFKPGVMKSSRGLILRHVLEHVPDPYRFLCDLRDANGGAGLIYIEVPCFDWICKKRTWFDIFYEHVNYFRMLDFFKMFGSVYASGKLFGDQYLYVVADLATLVAPKYTKKDAIHFPEDFLASLNSEEQNRTEQNRTEQSAVVWGGASKGVIFSLLRERIGKPVSAVVDVNPAKQGKFLPVTGLKVLSPESLLSQYPEGATVYVMNSNYIDEIKTMSLYRYNYVGVNQ
jgi:hypothetical protein